MWVLQNVVLCKTEPPHDEQSVLKTEIYMEEERDVNTCNLCSQTFSKYSELLKHSCSGLKTKKDPINLPNKKAPHACQICGKAFKLLAHLKRHVVVHTGEKHYVCEVCERPFGDKSTLKKHYKTHSGKQAEKKLKCEICENYFSNMSSMKTHLLIHTGEKGYECRFCGKAFR